MNYFGSVIFNDNLKFFRAFLSSIDAQTTHEFKLLLINDDVEPQKLKSILNEYPRINENMTLINTNGKYEPYELRILMIMEAKKNDGELLIIGDSDDLFLKNRVKCLIDFYRNNSQFHFFYNDLLFMDGENVMPKLPEVTSNIRDIGECNYLGLSNTAINVKLLDEKLFDELKGGKTRVFDWYLYSVLLNAGWKGAYVKNTGTIYRIYEQNIAGVVKDTVSAVDKEYQIKMEHYGLLKDDNEYFKNLYDKYSLLDVRDYYVQKIKQKDYWWNIINIKKGREMYV